ncbi:MAG TPA: trypsin-like peptidase domain-containing protein [Anaerolineales bacterium]|nr:trypsin-like peptidase domain-containing protein [Anaerolineales bacterium]HNB36476.1 trypsin-like peptidase domain-containing protein [Anaerolineales bacterium]HNC08254.1 trypsin-like peptidase domain-containing protein [Anaerolineales bacterium]
MKIRRIFLAVVVVALALLACQTPALVSQENSQEGNQSVNVSTVPTLMPVNLESSNPIAQQEVLVQLYQTVSPGTVAIITDVGQGSGFVYDTNGHVVTNYHVIEGAQSVEVRFTSGYRVYGTVIGTDLDSDLAVIEVDAPAEELHSLPLGDSAALNVGQTVVAIGNPFGLESTMTVGIISALGRTLDSAHTSPDGNFFTAGDIIQTDAAINPGNSGGPLFNLNGEVIGINRAIRTTNYTDTGEPVNSGIGFAISINIVKRVVPVLIKSGQYDYPYLGVSSISTLSLDAINELGLKQYTGAYVTTVVPGGPADKAGIKAGDKQTNFPNLFSGGDLIIAIDGREVRTFDDLLAYLITNKGPGDTVVLTILRGDEKMDVSIKLDKRP